MFIEFFGLENYAGILYGTLLNNIEIDFRLCKNTMTVIRGDGGSGKSTLQRCFSMFPDNNKEILPEMIGRKYGILDDNGLKYRFEIIYNYDKRSGKRNTICHLQKPDMCGEYIELNSPGTVRSYYDVLETEFGMDPNLIALSFLSTEDKGIVEKTAMDRKKVVSVLLEEVNVYNELNKAFTKKSNVIKSMLSTLSSKISSIGNKDNIKSSLVAIENHIIKLSKDRDNLISNRGKIEQEILSLDPDGSMQATKRDLIDNINKMIVEKNKIRAALNNCATNEKHGLVDNELHDLDLAVSKLASINNNTVKLKMEKDNLRSKLNDILLKREDESRAIELKTQRLMSLQSDCIYDNIEERMSQYQQMIDNCEKVFEDNNIKNAISISKDEYIIGLNVIKDIVDTIDAFVSFGYKYTIDEAISSVLNNVDIMTEYNKLTMLVESKSMEINKLGEQYNYCQGLLDKMNILSLRPTKCNITECSFIKDALDASNKHPEKDIDRLSNVIEELSQEVKLHKERLIDLDDVLLAVQHLKIIVRNIEVNRSIIAKLPIADMFIDKYTLFERIKNHHDFNDFREVYQSIRYANMFEDYKLANDALYKLTADYKLYSSRNEIIQELDLEITELETKLNDTLISVETINKEIQTYDKLIIDNEELYNTTNTFIKMISSYKDINNTIAEMQSRFNMINSNMSKIDNAIDRKTNIEIDLSKVCTELEPLMSQREQMSFNLEQLESWSSEYSVLSDKYTKLEIIKRYNSTSKDGIQNKYIEAYMNDTRELANEILKLFFGGRLELYPYDLSNGFRMPCYSHFSNMLNDDVSDCSRSEKAMATLAISIALMKQSGNRYNILKLDEIDEGLDSQNKQMFFPVLNKIFQMLHVEQCLLSTHSDQIDFSQCDIIQLRRINSSDDNADEGNYIFKLDDIVN